jgi:hypothetical protein
MKKVSAFVFRALITSFVITAISFFLRVASPEESSRQEMFGTAGFYGLVITASIFLIHLVLILIGYYGRTTHKTEKGI